MDPPCAVIELPKPPSVNHLYEPNFGRHGTHLSKDGVAYVKFIEDACKALPRFDKKRIKLFVKFHPENRRRCDLTNFCKILEDSLMKAGLMHDDSQIDDVQYIRCKLLDTAKVVVHLSEIPLTNGVATWETLE